MKVSSWARVPGPLDRYLRGFGEELARLGYAPRGVQWQMQLAGHLNAWLAGAGRGDADLNAATVEEFLAARRALGYVHFLSVKALNPLLEYLRQAGAAPLPVTMVAVTPAEAKPTVCPHHWWATSCGVTTFQYPRSPQSR